ncbi:MAG TPA: TolC family protein, partial [Candidatus Mcinerneyibacterium sp.]|nr:TolC family protein [Candidatus Mcinerneyibacterium sp.]
MRKKLLIISILIIFVTISHGEIWNLEKCINFALKRNKNLINKKRELEISGRNVANAYGNFLPSIKLEGSKVLAESKVETQMQSYELAPIPETSLLGISGVTTETYEQDMISNYQYSLSASQPIFMGGSLFYNLKNKKIEKNISFYKLKDEKMNLIFDVSSTYYNLIYTKSMLDNVKESIAIVKEQVEMVKARYESGEASNLDLLQARVELNKLYPQKIKLKSAYKNGKRNLTNILGLKSEKSFQIDPNFKMLSLKHKENYSKLFEFAKNNYPGLKILELKSKALDNTEIMTKGSYLPKILLTGSFGQQKEEWSDSWSDNYNLMLTFSWNIFDGLNRETNLANVYTNQDILNDSYYDLYEQIK